MKEKIELYRAEIEKAYNESPFWGKEHNDRKRSFTIDWGKKFAKINHESWGSKSIHCFVEIANGNIWKAATYKAPQKNGIRGNIDNPKKPLFSEDFYVKY
jgi:hypothetical protein